MKGTRIRSAVGRLLHPGHLPDNTATMLSKVSTLRLYNVAHMTSADAPVKLIFICSAVGWLLHAGHLPDNTATVLSKVSTVPVYICQKASKYDTLWTPASS